MRRLHSILRSPRRGSIIVVVLALVSLAAFLLTRFIDRAMTEMLVETRARQSDLLRGDAFSALETTLAVLADYHVEDHGLRSPAQGWGNALEEAKYEPRPGIKVEVSFEDESGKLSLPRIDQRGLEDLGRAMGLRDQDADRFADAMLAWTRREHVSAEYVTDPRNYEYETPPHHAPGRPIESFRELAAVAVVRDLLFDKDGQPNEYYDRLTQMVSLYDFSSVNLNGVRPDVLVYAGLEPAQISRWEEFQSGRDRLTRKGPRYFRNRAEAEAVLGMSLPPGSYDTQIQLLRVKVTASAGGTAFHLEALIQPGGRNNREDTSAPPTANQEPATQAVSTGQTGSGALQYPFTVLALDESVDLQPAPSL